jgi:hypothetical protein
VKYGEGAVLGVLFIGANVENKIDGIQRFILKIY